MLRRETRLDWESELRLRGVDSDVRRGGHKNKRGKGIKRFGGGSITGPPNNVRIKPRTRNTFRKNAPPPYRSNAPHFTRANNNRSQKKGQSKKYDNKNFRRAQPKRTPTSAATTTGKSKVRCHNCDKLGHYARDCRAPKKGFNRRNNPSTGYYNQKRDPRARRDRAHKVTGTTSFSPPS